MKKLISIDRKTKDNLGIIKYLDSGVEKSALFDKKKNDKLACHSLGIEYSQVAKNEENK